MNTTELVKDYAGGQLSRRDLLLSLSAVFVIPRAPRAPGMMAQSPTKAPITTRFLNNTMIAVSNLQRSVDFYQKLFGAPIQQGNVAIFRVGGGPRFFGLTEATGGAKPGYLSYGIAIDNFDPDRTMKTLAEAGVKGAQVTMRGTTPELWVPDPNGIKIQLQDPAYGYGTGPRGDVLPAARSATQPPLLLKTFSHMTLTIKDGPRSMEFYEKVFGLRVQAMQGTTACLAVGTGPDFLAVNTRGVNPNANAGVNHACLTIENFDPQKVMGVLINSGLEPIEYGGQGPARPMTCRARLRQRAGNGGGPTSPLGTPELYFQDPDNINVQIADVKYCGGSGWLGEICP